MHFRMYKSGVCGYRGRRTSHYRTKGFYGCTSLKSVEFSKGTLSVGAYAFARCSSLKNVDMSGSQIYELGQFAFGECYSITDLKLSEYTKTLGDYCFQGCNRIKT